MADIYSVKLDRKMDDINFYTLLNLVSPEKRARIKRFKFPDDAQRCLLGDILTRYAVCSRFNLNNKQLRFTSNEYGKPFLRRPQGLHFNISHSGSYVVCAVNHKPVGIDVETIKPIDFNIAKRFFAKDEYIDLMSKKDMSERLKYFYYIWTLKESYIKAEGKGLSIPLDSFSFKVQDSDIQIESNNTDILYSFWTHQIDSSHIVSLCSQHKILKHNIKQVSILQLLSIT